MPTTPTTPTTPLVAVVTGASSGIGLAVARVLAGAGHTVIGTSRDASRVTAPDGVTVLDLDVTSQTSVDALVAEVLARHGRIDVLVNNAGAGASGGAEETSTEQDQRLFDSNVFGLMRMTRAVLPHMRARGRGRIVNISSVVGFVPSPYMAGYAASKHAVEGWSESLDHEVREHGVRVVLVQPAWTNTSFEANAAGPDRPMDLYADRRRTSAGIVAAAVRAGDDPSVVGEVVLLAATAASPRVRYTAGPLAGRLALARRFAPARVVDRQIRTLNRLPAVR